jgi:formate dehydrogenase maturation protein FdhE
LADDPEGDRVMLVIHVPDCACKKPIHRYKCRNCKRVVGWCFGAHDEIERPQGPICDECASLMKIVSLEETGR